jgi:hypothetical protein
MAWLCDWRVIGSVFETELRGWYRKNYYMGISRATLPQGLKEQGEITVLKGA